MGRPTAVEHSRGARFRGSRPFGDSATATNIAGRTADLANQKVFVGTGDPAVDTGEVEAWRSDTVSAFVGHTSEGDHYVHHTHRGTVAALTGQVSERTNDAIAS